jgi:hypothetical protein
MSKLSLSPVQRRLQHCDARADDLDNARQVGAQSQGQRLRLNALPRPDPSIPRPYSGRLDADEHLALARQGPRDIFERDNIGRAEAVDAACLHPRALRSEVSMGECDLQRLLHQPGGRHASCTSLSGHPEASEIGFIGRRFLRPFTDDSRTLDGDGE